MQRLLWASTSTKNDPAAPDDLYVRALAAPYTVNTMPEQTLLSFADHGTLGPALSPDAGAAEEVLRKIAQVGIDVDTLAAQLQEAGAAAFVKSWDELLTVLDAKARVQ